MTSTLQTQFSFKMTEVEANKIIRKLSDPLAEVTYHIGDLAYDRIGNPQLQRLQKFALSNFADRLVQKRVAKGCFQYIRQGAVK